MANDKVQIVSGSNAMEFGRADQLDHTFWIIRAQEDSGAGFSLEISTEPDRETALEILVRGELDSSMIPDLNHALDLAFDGVVQTVILDLSEVPFVSKRGFVALLVANHRLGCRNVTLMLTHLQPQILRILRIWNALPGFTLFKNPEEMDKYFAAMQMPVRER